MFTAALRALRSQLSESTRKTLLWLSCATLLSSTALVGAVVTGRVLPLPLLGSAAVVGNTLSAAWDNAFAPASQGARKLTRLLPIGLLSLLHFGLSPLVRVGTALQFRTFAEAQRELAQQANLGGGEQRGSLYLLSGSDPILAMYTGASLRFYTPEKAGAERLRVLSMAPQPLRFTHSARNTFELEVLELPRKQNSFETLYRPPERPLMVGQHVRTAELEVTVLGVASGVYTKARFEFHGDLAHEVCFVSWKDGRLKPLPLPELGTGVPVPYEPGPMGM